MDAKATLTGTTLLVFFLSLSGCGHEAAEDKAPAVETRVVEDIDLVPVREDSVAASRSLAGTVRARTASHVAARVMAQVEKVHAREGQRVSQGDLLVELDDREFRSRLNQAESALGQGTAQLELATLTRDRYQMLLEGKAISQQEYDTVAASEKTAREAVAQAEAAVSEARTYLGFTRILSPCEGIVAKRHLDPGSMAAPGAPILTIEAPTYQVEVPLDSSEFHGMETGTRFYVEVESAGFSGEVRVSEVAPSVDPMSRTLTVKAGLPVFPGLRSGQYARVSVPGETRSVLSIPSSALVTRGQMDGVYLVPEDGTVRFRLVKTGARPDGRVEVISGLNSGDRIVARDTERVSEGVRVQAGQAR